MSSSSKVSAPTLEKAGSSNSSVSLDPSEGISQVVKAAATATAPPTSVLLSQGAARVSACPEINLTVKIGNTSTSQVAEKVLSAIKRAHSRSGRRRKSVDELLPVLHGRVPKLMRAAESSHRVANYLECERIGVVDLTLIDTIRRVERLEHEVYRRPVGREMGAGAGKAGVA